MLIDKPIHPIIRFGKQLTRDEMYAAIISALLTAAAYFIMTSMLNMGAVAIAAILPFVGPVLEKPGLVAHYIKEGYQEHKEHGGSLYQHIRTALCDGRAWSTVRADILFHDPGYAGLMMLGMFVFTPQTVIAVGFLSVLSFVGGLVFATVLEVYYIEYTYNRHTKKLIKKGYEQEKYYESRYLVTNDGEPDHKPMAVFNKLKAHLDLPDVFEREYYDWYGKDGALMFNGRECTTRYRERTSTEGGYDETFGPKKSTTQIVYSRPGQLDKNGASLFRCYFIEKDKFSLIGEKTHENEESLRFSRMVARDPKGLFITVDCLNNGKPVDMYWIEVKVHPENLDMLLEANEYIAMMFPVQGTTHNKSRIVNTFMS